MNVRTPKSEKWQLPCCALAQLQLNSDVSEKEIEYQIERAKVEAKELWHPETRRSGERSFFAIVSPNENELRAKLLKLKFQKIWTFPRRNGYPKGELEMYALKW